MESIVSNTFGMPTVIAAAVSEIMGKVKSLPKGEWNGHGQFNFASIDDFLAAVGPMCAEAGLIVLQDEDGLEMIERNGKGWLRITYTFTLAHKSGVLWERPMRRTVIQQISGPQTTGGTQSYALKMFMRSLFQIPTGDRDDADYQPKHEMDTRTARQEGQGRNQPAIQPPAPVKLLEATPSASDGSLTRIGIPQGNDGLQVGTWTRLALEALAGMPDQAGRIKWLAFHSAELAEVTRLKPDYARKVEEVAKASDPATKAA